MKINSIKIEKLFDIFDYDISFKKNENILIITGANGFGKTMILNIIFSLFNRKFEFFQKLVFEKITLELDENIQIIISKELDSSGMRIFLRFCEKDSKTNEYKVFQIFDYPNEFKIGQTNPEFQLLQKINRSSPIIDHILTSFSVYLIKEHRLTEEQLFFTQELQESTTVIIQTIAKHAEALIHTISIFSDRALAKTQELDSSYPNRLIKEKNIFSEQEYTEKYNTLKTKQEKLTKFGLYESKQDFPAYSPDDAKALTVYLKDFEMKLGVFDELLENLELFTDILNKRRFTFKSININRIKGFYFTTNQGKELELTQLSSGEQHEVVLLYELIFNVKSNVLVLIDEPEISLHITWQKEFLNDLLKINNINKNQIIIATHAPAIINDRWDLVYNLEQPKK